MPNGLSAISINGERKENRLALPLQPSIMRLDPNKGNTPDCLYQCDPVPCNGTVILTSLSMLFCSNVSNTLRYG